MKQLVGPDLNTCANIYLILFCFVLTKSMMHTFSMRTQWHWEWCHIITCYPNKPTEHVRTFFLVFHPLWNSLSLALKKSFGFYLIWRNFGKVLVFNSVSVTYLKLKCNSLTAFITSQPTLNVPGSTALQPFFARLLIIPQQILPVNLWSVPGPQSRYYSLWTLDIFL